MCVSLIVSLTAWDFYYGNSLKQERGSCSAFDLRKLEDFFDSFGDLNLVLNVIFNQKNTNTINLTIKIIIY